MTLFLRQVSYVMGVQKQSNVEPRNVTMEDVLITAEISEHALETVSANVQIAKGMKIVFMDNVRE